ncbi:MAG TPA: SH3 domain-containing protein [Devosia sp.]|nr:SH3 domain-containing protein [Devosia sp.]
MRLGTVLHLVIWPSLALVGGALLVTPRDILRQPIIHQSAETRVAALNSPDIIPATLTVRATAVQPVRERPVLDLAVANIPEAAPVAAPAAALDQRWTTAGSLNLRSGPSTRAGLIASLPFGTPVEVMETSGNWARVAAGDAEGWLSTKFLSADQPN